jgi:2-keto-4-pentenoate hydratase
VIAATAYALPAIEIVGSRIADWKRSLVDTIADNARRASTRRHRAEEDRCADPRLCGMVMTRRGEAVSLGVGAACPATADRRAGWPARWSRSALR